MIDEKEEKKEIEVEKDTEEENPDTQKAFDELNKDERKKDKTGLIIIGSIFLLLIIVVIVVIVMNVNSSSKGSSCGESGGTCGLISLLLTKLPH
jgi:t-SNARE complex subunit (syntaxin)